ncbi:MAG TPA: AAA family ATPase [Propionibacteriaceae bacterium]|jgi:chloramphenicol 3-O-phosphotransferase|nr:AAA family ATPase [Propionibacteriaceae bacterium]
MSGGRVIMVTGAMAAGKSTVANLLAERLPRSVHVRGDMFRRMVVNGRADMGPIVSPEALAQLRLRYELATYTADRYAAAGFTVVLQDVVIGRELADFVGRIATPDRYLVVLAPSVATLERREQARAKTGYAGFSPADLDRVLREDTPRLGYWLDSSDLSPAATADAILANLAAAAF